MKIGEIIYRERERERERESERIIAILYIEV